MVHHPYFIEEGPPPTIIEVNSQEYTEKTESVAGDAAKHRHSPYNNERIFARINNKGGHRQTLQNIKSQ